MSMIEEVFCKSEKKRLFLNTEAKVKLVCDNCMGENDVDETILDQQGFRSECSICGHMIFLDSDTIDAIMLRKKRLKAIPDEKIKQQDNRQTFKTYDFLTDDMTTTLSAEIQLDKASTSPAEFTVVEGPDAGMVVSMNTNRLVFGRRGADVNLSDRLISRRHAAVEAGGGRYLLKDLGSTNGTFLNGHSAGMDFLKHGDEIQMGSTLIRFCIVGMESNIVVFR
jgi:pSer/pThr/pTyr-binding forkhead associated (FHA) protein